jgi:hypothetical protein
MTRPESPPDDALERLGDSDAFRAECERLEQLSMDAELAEHTESFHDWFLSLPERPT